MNHDTESSNNLDILHFDKNGFVALCGNCGKVQLGFGVTVIMFDPVEFSRWYENLYSEIARFENRICPREKFFMFTTDSEFVRLMLSWNELNALYGLLAPAIMILEARNLLDSIER